MPVNGSVVGHIINGTYVAKDSSKRKKLSARSTHLLKYGNVAFAHQAGSELYSTLSKTFHPDDAKVIYALALIRTAFGDVKDYQVEDKHEKSWVKILYPDVHLSKSSISKLLEIIQLPVHHYDLQDEELNQRKEPIQVLHIQRHYGSSF